MVPKVSDQEPQQQPDVFDISPEFIEEERNKKLGLSKPGKKNSKYTKSERSRRRNHVYRLYFEQGCPQ
ncbi:hypothetical protein [Nitrososphaera viennensis]|uniref:Uncharacterized protein n=1 Tax=Nitrososphaera viennensis TaxID=1034015 RepID=A0A977NM05_9ARCH|nr:hypothetical protein [Nitrososphaera viennensis]UVS68360.1 hypothetical protein NWT39_10675 [Nitrososphaera viennensis]